ncbi:MAG: hypothetical protein IJA69_06300 [Clostridia bacterium]|nr:hypothetical protein [Clostridia bacterium]
MAFKKTEENPQITSNLHGLATKNPEPPAKATMETVSVPLCIKKQKNSDGVVYVGFIPGIIMRDIQSGDLEDCKEKLLAKAKDKLREKASLSGKMPYFPTNDEIVKDFDNIVVIKRIKFTFRKSNALI